MTRDKSDWEEAASDIASGDQAWSIRNDGISNVETSPLRDTMASLGKTRRDSFYK